MKNKLQTNLPAMAYIEAQVIHRAVANGALSKFVRDLEKEYEVPPNSFLDGVYLQTRIVTLLYCLIVIPKEIWDLKPDHSIYRGIGVKWSLDDVTIIRHRDDYYVQPIYYFVHHLRNAVAHAHISFADGAFTFGDKHKHETELSFKASMSIEKLERFLEVVGTMLANLKNEEAQQDASSNH